MSTPTLDNQLCFALYSASNRLSSIYRPILKTFDLTYTQFIVLLALWEEDGISISHLAKRTGLTNATMTPLLKLLEKKKLITRQLLAGNERQKDIVLTDAGRRLSFKSKEITQEAFCSTGLTKKQAKEMILCCQQIVARELIPS